MRLPAFRAIAHDRRPFSDLSAPTPTVFPAWRTTDTPSLTFAGCVFLAAIVLSAGAMPAVAQTTASSAEIPVYCLDPVHTRVMFAIEHAGFSKAIGTVSGSTGELRFDPDDWSKGNVRVSVPLTRLDLGDEKWNKAALAGNLLDGARYPDAVFVSDRIETSAENRNRAIVHGTLTLHGVSRPIALDTTLNVLKRHPLPPFRRTAGFSARAMLSRKAFGIDAWPSVIGDEVELRIEAEAIRGRCDQTDEAVEPPPPADNATKPAQTDSSNNDPSAVSNPIPDPETPR